MELDETFRKTILKVAMDYFTETLQFSQSLKLVTTLNVIVDCTKQYDFVVLDEIKRSDTWLNGEGQSDPVGDSSSIVGTHMEETDEVEREEIDCNDDTNTCSSDPGVFEDTLPTCTSLDDTSHTQETWTESSEDPKEPSACPVCFGIYQNLEYMSKHLVTAHQNCCDDTFKCLVCDQACLKIEEFVKHWLDKHKGRGVKDDKCDSNNEKRIRGARRNSKKQMEQKENELPGVKTRQTKEQANESKNTNNKGVDSHIEISEISDHKIKETLKIKIRKTDIMIKGNTDKISCLKVDYSDTPLECTLCGNQYTSQRAFRRHYSVKHANTVHPCDVCGKTFNCKEGLYHHRKGLHSNVKAFKCSEPGCDASFNFNHSLKLHILKHTGSRPHKCTVCEKTYLTAYHLKVHFTGVHMEKKEYTCKTCGKGFSYSTSLRVHEATHGEKTRKVCNTCDKTFVNAQALKYHHMSKHAEPGHFKCRQCNKVYKSEILLKAHERRHTNDNNRFMCDICGRRYMYKSALEMHKSVHGDEKSFSCKVCQKAFKTYATLYSHMFVHREDSSFECETCGKAFKTKERMKAHARRHAGLKPFECQVCHHCFPDNGGLSKHMKTVHCPVKKFICDICGKSTTRADNLRVHMKVHAKGNVKPTMTVEQSKVQIPMDDFPATVPLVIDDDYNNFEIKKKQRKPRASNKQTRKARSYLPQNEAETSTSRETQQFYTNMPHFSTIDSSQISAATLPSVPTHFHDSATASPVNGIPAHLANDNMIIINTDNNTEEIANSTVTNVPSTITSGTISVTPMQPVNYMTYAWPFYNPGPQQGGAAHGFYQQ